MRIGQREPFLPLIENVFVQRFRRVRIGERILGDVVFSVASMCPHHLHIQAVTAVLDELFDPRNLIAVPCSICVPSADVQKLFRIPRSADEDMPPPLPLEPS